MTGATQAIAARRGLSVSRSQVLGVAYLALAAVILFLFTGVEANAQTTFNLNLGGDTIQVPNLVVPSAGTAYVLAGLAAFAGAVQLTRGLGGWGAMAAALAVFAFVFGFLTWAGAGGSMNLTGIFESTLQRAVPITFGALSGVLCERAGVVNVAIEGMLLTGAFVAAVVGSIAGSWIGLVAAIAAGGLIAALLAVLAIRYRVDQIVAGILINILALGLTSYLSAGLLTEVRELNSPERFGPVEIPFLSTLPIVGPVLFRNSIFVYFMFAAIIVLHVMLFKTRYGLRVRAVGEHPKAADTVGIDVHFIRYRNVILGGMLAGLGGAFFTIGSTGQFEQEMTAGRGFIGLAAMIFGGWNPIGAFGAGLVFGFADALQNRLSILNIAVPSQLMAMVPYVVTIIVVAGLVGRVRAPAADGRPYHKE
ncbi:MAG: ABC transporter permease [Candidatus Limnocylindria bacterium]